MTDGKERILDGLRKAMQAEKEGQHFYLMAAAKTEDEQGRQVFQDLANDEVEHFHFLRGQYKAVSETGKTDPHLKLGAAKTYEGGHPIFSDAIKSRIGGAHFEMTALSIGAQLELSAVNFYQAEADQADDPDVRAFYEVLADWERGHLTALQTQLESLKEEYWNQGGFSPF